jgi:hypothetical protein
MMEVYQCNSVLKWQLLMPYTCSDWIWHPLLGLWKPYCFTTVPVAILICTRTVPIAVTGGGLVGFKDHRSVWRRADPSYWHWTCRLQTKSHSKHLLQFQAIRFWLKPRYGKVVQIVVHCPQAGREISSYLKGECLPVIVGCSSSTTTS